MFVYGSCYMAFVFFSHITIYEFYFNSCEHEIDECQSDPCQNGATCIDLLAEYKCECPEDFVGLQCETLRLVTCDNKPCKFGAKCEDGKSK